MRVFIYEYICGGGLAGQPLPESLARQGWAMLRSIVEDFARVESCQVLTLLDERFADRPLAARWFKRAGQHDERNAIACLAEDCDGTLLIAPESDGQLFERTRWVEEAGGRLLGSSSSAVAIAADKYSCGELLRQAGVPIVRGRIVRVGDGLPMDSIFPAVLKPRDGAGSQSTFLISDPAAGQALQDAAAAGLRGEALLQPFVPGLASSVTFLIGPTGAMPLLPGQQLLSEDGRFRYLGGRMPIPPDLARRAVQIANRAIAAVSGLRGFVGVDLVLGRSDAEDTIVEINPRLTTSYVGLRQLAGSNLAEALLRTVAGEPMEPIAWRPGTVGFSADGQVNYEGADPGKMSR